MDIFIEKGFIENFEIEYDPHHATKVQSILYSIFSDYAELKLFTDIPDSEIEAFSMESLLLSNLFSYNPSHNSVDDFEKYLAENEVNYQTLVFTEDYYEWHLSLAYKSVLCFSWDNYEEQILKFTKNTHFRVDLSDYEYPFKWKTFNFVDGLVTFLLFSDPYILTDSTGQKIKDNIGELLKQNLNRENPYKVFIITKLEESEEVIEGKIKRLNSILANYNAKIYLFNRLSNLEKMIMHDRLLYTNYTVTTVGSGFNISNRESNSEIISESIFEKYTYKKLATHLKKIKEYISKLESWEQYDKPYKTNSQKAYKSLYSSIQ